jgi:hypothetical protein
MKCKNRLLDIREISILSPEYPIRVRFNNGEGGLVDLTEALWGPMFESLKDPAFFRKFKVSEVLHTICWENDADLAPEYVYDRMVEQGCASPGLT